MRLFIGILSGFFTLGGPAWWEPAFLPGTWEIRPALSTDPVGYLAPDPQDIQVFEEKIQLAQAAPAHLAAQTLAVAQSFAGVPYVAGTLNHGDTETLTVNLHQLDCWTFMENSLALALAARSAQPTFDSLQHFVQQLRYWGGTVDGYASRIHYFSGWLLQAEKLGYLRDCTQELGGIPYRNKIGYMSARPQRYPALRDPATLRKIQQVEKRLNQHAWHYIPQDRVAKIESRLRDGDLIALTSWKRDLDIAHQGFAVRKNGRVYLLHASSLGKKVLLSAQPLAQYLRSQKGQTGIMVARLNDL